MKILRGDLEFYLGKKQLTRALDKELDFIVSIKNYARQHWDFVKSPLYTRYDSHGKNSAIHYLYIVPPMCSPKTEAKEEDYVAENKERILRKRKRPWVIETDNRSNLLKEKRYFEKLGYHVFWNKITDYADDHKGSPITKEYLKRKRYLRAWYIFHEETHFTLESRNILLHRAIEESVANYVGYRGCLDFFEQRKDWKNYGRTRREMNRELGEAKRLNNLIDQLDQLYDNPPEDWELQRQRLLQSARATHHNEASLMDQYLYQFAYPLLCELHPNISQLLEACKKLPYNPNSAMKILQKRLQ